MRCRKSLPKVAFTTTLSQEQFAALEYRAAQDKIPRSHVLGAAIDFYLAYEMSRADEIIQANTQKRRDLFKTDITKLQAVEHK